MSGSMQQIISLNDLNQGAIDEIVKAKLPEILDNLGDENTKWSVERGLDIKIRFKMNSESRETMTTTVEVFPKLAAPKAHESIAHLNFTGSHVEAYGVKQEPEQLELNENIADFAEGKAANGNE